jgi:hypothetical protein
MHYLELIFNCTAVITPILPCTFQCLSRFQFLSYMVVKNELLQPTSSAIIQSPLYLLKNNCWKFTN